MCLCICVRVCASCHVSNTVLAPVANAFVEIDGDGFELVASAVGVGGDGAAFGAAVGAAVGAGVGAGIGAGVSAGVGAIDAPHFHFGRALGQSGNTKLGWIRLRGSIGSL